MAMEALLQGTDVITKKDGVVPASKFNDVEVVGLYFSAHWCPPCRQFTPILSAFYENMKKDGKNFELIFVSSDKDQGAFDEYHGSMTFNAVPYENRNLKQALSKKFKVEGIPSLVLLDGRTGETITKSGVEKVYGDKSGKNFPWKPKPLLELIGDSFVNGEGKKFDASALKDKYLGIYFSAHWCGPCRSFTPSLAKFYTDYHTMKDFEIVFVSSDHDEESFHNYVAEMPWIAVPFKDSDRRTELSSFFEVQGIPTLVFLDKDRKIITSNGRGAVMSDPDGADFPWKPKKVGELNGMTAPMLNESAGLILLSDKLTGTAQTDAINKFVEIGTSFQVDGKEDFDLKFYYAKSAKDLNQRIRQILKVKDSDVYVLVDFPNQSMHVTKLKLDASADDVKEIASLYISGKLEMKALG